MQEQVLDGASVEKTVKLFLAVALCGRMLRAKGGKPWRGKVDCITGGYPCQPFSVAGKKLGDKDPRHLWPDIKRIVSEVEPNFCFFENVGGHLRLGYEQVDDDLRRVGYQVKAGLFSAFETGAPHKRERLFILAYRTGSRCHGGSGDIKGRQVQDDQDGKACERSTATAKTDHWGWLVL